MILCLTCKACKFNFNVSLFFSIKKINIMYSTQKYGGINMHLFDLKSKLSILIFVKYSCIDSLG